MRNIVRATGEERWLIVRSSPILDPETGRIVYAVNVFENITEVKRAQLAESFMAEASRVLASSMDYAETLQRVARLAVPTDRRLVRGRPPQRARARSNGSPFTTPTRPSSRWPSASIAPTARRSMSRWGCPR